MWIIDLFVTHLNPHPRTPTRLFTHEVLRAKERIPILYSTIFIFGLTFESYEKFGVRYVSSIVENDIWFFWIHLITSKHQQLFNDKLFC
jgi:hypothetical protein